MKLFSEIIRESRVSELDAVMYRESILFLHDEFGLEEITEAQVRSANNNLLAYTYYTLRDKMSDGLMENISSISPSILNIPDDKQCNELPLDHYLTLIEEKGYDKISRCLINIILWNKISNRPLAEWANKTYNTIKRKYKK